MKNHSVMESGVFLESRKTSWMVQCALDCSVYGCDGTLELAHGRPCEKAR